jgi:hypothetical protein
VRPTETAKPLSKREEAAALLVAQDALPDVAIAARCKIGKATLERWKQRPAFQARVAEHRALWREQLRAQGLLEQQNRLAALNDRWTRLQQVITERAASPEMQSVPGGTTGLLVRQVKSIGFGENNQLVEEFAVDTPLLKELREHEKQAAQELGEWTEKRELGGQVLIRGYGNVPIDQV